MPRPDRFDTPTPLDEDPDDVPASLRGLGFRPFGAGISQNNPNMDWEEFSGAVDAQAGQAFRDRRRMAWIRSASIDAAASVLISGSFGTRRDLSNRQLNRAERP